MEQQPDNPPGGDETARLLQCSAESGDSVAVSRLILNAGESFNINKHDDVSGKMLLYWPVQNGHLETTRVLVSLGADVNGLSLVQIYCQLPGNDMVILCELEHPLITAVRGRNMPMVRLLLQEGANVNVQTGQRYMYGALQLQYLPDKTPLHFAALQESAEMMRILLEYGGNPNVPDQHGQSVLHWAADSWCYCKSWGGAYYGSQHYQNVHEQQSTVLKLLCSSYRYNADALNMALYRAVVVCECMGKADILLNAGADINVQLPSTSNYCTETALHFAAHSNNTVMARFLINNGAILSVTDGDGETPLAKNIRFLSRSRIAAILILHGASLEGKDKWNRSLIDACIQANSPRTDCNDLCYLLVFSGCRVTTTYQRPHNKQQSKEETLCDWLEMKRRNPHRLDALSRICIRKFLSENVVKGRSLVQTVMKMDNLQKVIVDYLLLKDIANMARFLTVGK